MLFMISSWGAAELIEVSTAQIKAARECTASRRYCSALVRAFQEPISGWQYHPLCSRAGYTLDLSLQVTLLNPLTKPGGLEKAHLRSDNNRRPNGGSDFCFPTSHSVLRILNCIGFKPLPFSLKLPIPTVVTTSRPSLSPLSHSCAHPIVGYK